MIYSMDTPTNVLPSIHVFNSMAVYFAVKNSPKLKNNKAVRTGAFVMTSLIILSNNVFKTAFCSGCSYCTDTILFKL
ncbi:MAG: hypothetical protein ACLVIY_11195 [Anaerobutyricum soehngenii]